MHPHIFAYYIVAFYLSCMSSVFFTFIDTRIFIIAINFYLIADVQCLTLDAHVHKYEGKCGAEGQL